MKPVLIQLEDDFASRIDGERGDVPRTVWIRRACEAYLAQDPQAASMGRTAVLIQDTRERVIRSAAEKMTFDDVRPPFARGLATHFPCGHPRIEANLQSVGKAGVRCKECRRAISLRSQRKRVSTDPTKWLGPRKTVPTLTP